MKSLFVSVFRAHRGQILYYWFLGVSASLLGSGSVRAFQLVLDAFSASALSLLMLAGYGALLAMNCLANYLQNWPEQQLSHGIYYQLKLDALRKMRTIAFTAYQRLGTGALIQRIEAGAAAGARICFEYALNLAANLLPQMLISLAFIYLVSPLVAVWVLAGYLVVFAVANLLLKLLYRIKQRVLVDEEQLSHTLVRGFMELVVFRLNRRFAREIQRAEASARSIADGNARMRMIHEGFFTAFALLVVIMKLVVLVYALLTRSLSVGELVAVTALLDNAYQPIAIFNVLYVQYKLDRVALERYLTVLASQDTPHLTDGLRHDLAGGSVRFEQVSFRYGDSWVYEDLSFSIENGQVVGLAGESGSGKSSVVRQIIGLVGAQQGRVLVDGVRVDEMNLEHYYQFLSYTPQEPPVFDGTLRENVLFDARLEDEAVWRALRLVELEDWARRLPQGLDTPVGEKGILLSGGERQRLALARLYFQTQARLFILDEATSAMDTLTELRVMERLLAALSGRTVILVAHRLSTLRTADNILLLRHGRLVGQGSFTSLERENEYFQQLLAARQ